MIRNLFILAIYNFESCLIRFLNKTQSIQYEPNPFETKPDNPYQDFPDTYIRFISVDRYTI